jgi:hypothetical protein
MLLAALAAVVVSATLAGCSDDEPTDQSASTASSETTASTDTAPTDSATTGSAAVDGGAVSASELCEGAEPQAPSPLVESSELVEISGLAASRQNEGILWTHNDSGGEPEALAITDEGGGGARYRLDGVEAIDWEDMTLGPGPEEGVDYLYMGDIGDNFSQRSEVVIYRVPEPTTDASGTEPVLLEDDVEAIRLTYADGSRDAEALLSDPVTGDLFIVSKEWAGDPVGVYRVPADSTDKFAVTQRAAEAPVPAGELVTSGDISADGSLIAIRTYDSVLLWDRRPDQTVAEAMAGQPCQAPVVDEDQGEAIALAPDGRGYVTISEGANPPVHWFRLPG